MDKLILGFVRSERGNVAMMFGLFLIPIILGAGIAIDMLRVNKFRSDLTEAADAGLLAAARAMSLDSSVNQTEAETIAKKYFEANFTAADGSSLDNLNFDFDPATDSFTVTINASIDHVFMPIVGNDASSLVITSEAKVAAPRNLEIALVLDNTYSMTGSKLSTLKTAAGDLVDEIMVDDADNVEIAVIPFSQYVNIGLSRRDASWLEVDDDSSTTTNQCFNTYPDRTESNCTTTTTTCGGGTRDGVPQPEYSCNQTSCDVDLGDPVSECRDVTTTSTWHGCVGSRNNPLDVEDRDYATDKIPGLMNLQCTQEITVLTTNKTTVENALNSMAVQGSETYIPAGVMWGYRALSSIEPLTEGMTYEDMQNDKALKAMVIMTDGMNTKSPSYPRHDGSGGAGADDLLKDQCTEIKSDGIEVYTIAFEISDTSIKDLLSDCASSTANYFDATDAEELKDAFVAIAGSLTELALTK